MGVLPFTCVFNESAVLSDLRTCRREQVCCCVDRIPLIFWRLIIRHVQRDYGMWFAGLIVCTRIICIGPFKQLFDDNLYCPANNISTDLIVL
jgi:hypothetical protein